MARLNESFLETVDLRKTYAVGKVFLKDKRVGYRLLAGNPFSGKLGLAAEEAQRKSMKGNRKQDGQLAGL
jgi:hypothetical protein